jgi:LPS sulfotransferase NodH
MKDEPTRPASSIGRSYLICATPRSGSNFLCEVLRSAAVAGYPDDYFWNPPFWWQRWGVSDFPSYFWRILQEGTTPNGVFGSKMMWDYLGELVPQLAALFHVAAGEPSAVLAAAFPNLRYVWLTRRDKVRQGISYYRALETRIWRSTDGSSGPATDPPFNFLAIDRLVQLSNWEDEGWQGYFQQHRSKPLVVAYEDLAQAPEEVAQQILSHLGLPQAQWLDRSWQHQRQADTLTDAWVERYRALKGTSA